MMTPEERVYLDAVKAQADANTAAIVALNKAINPHGPQASADARSTMIALGALLGELAYLSGRGADDLAETLARVLAPAEAAAGNLPANAGTLALSSLDTIRAIAEQHLQDRLAG